MYNDASWLCDTSSLDEFSSQSSGGKPELDALPVEHRLDRCGDRGGLGRISSPCNAVSPVVSPIAFIIFRLALATVLSCSAEEPGVEPPAEGVFGGAFRERQGLGKPSCACSVRDGQVRLRDRLLGGDWSKNLVSGESSSGEGARQDQVSKNERDSL